MTDVNWYWEGEPDPPPGAPARHAEEALYRLVEAYLGLGITDEAQTAGAILGHNYPDGEWYKDAYALLKSGGLEPRENQESWISKLYHTIVPS